MDFDFHKCVLEFFLPWVRQEVIWSGRNAILFGEVKF